MKALTALFLLCLSVSFVEAQRPDAPLYARHGAYGVGTREFSIADDERPLTVTVWYPADCDPGSEPTHNYLLALAFTVPGHACVDATTADSDSPFPLVVLSHGSGASRVMYLWLTEHLASQGFFVIAADHPGNTVVQTFAGSMNVVGSGQDFAGSYALRPDDVLRQITFAESLNANGDFAGKIDLNNIGVIGHSFGGWTALSAGGAQIDFGKLQTWCDENRGTDENVCFLRSMKTQIAQKRGVEASDEAWSPTTDARIKAIVALAPWNAPILNFDGITAATMIMVGTNDKTTIPERDAYAAYEAISAPKSLVTFDYGSHYIFGDACSPVLLTFGVFDSCSDEVWDMTRVHDLSNQFVTAFFLTHLKGDEAAIRALNAENVDFPGVSYQAE